MPLIPLGQIQPGFGGDSKLCEGAGDDPAWVLHHRQSGLTLLFLPFPLLPRVPELKLHWAPALPSSLALRAALPSSATQQSPLLLSWLPTSSKETRTGSAPHPHHPPGGISWQCWPAIFHFLPTTLTFRVTKIKIDLSLLLQPWPGRTARMATSAHFCMVHLDTELCLQVPLAIGNLDGMRTHFFLSFTLAGHGVNP